MKFTRTDLGHGRRYWQAQRKGRTYTISRSHNCRFVWKIQRDTYTIAAGTGPGFNTLSRLLRGLDACLREREGTDCPTCGNPLVAPQKVRLEYNAKQKQWELRHHKCRRFEGPNSRVVRRSQGVAAQPRATLTNTPGSNT